MKNLFVLITLIKKLKIMETFQLILFCLIPFITLFIFAYIFDKLSGYIAKKYNQINNN